MTDESTPQPPSAPASGQRRTEKRRSDSSSGRRVRIGAVLAIAVAAAFIAWVAIGSRSGDSSSTETTAGTETEGPVILSADGLATLAGVLGQPIYWVGPGATDRYEFSQSDSGRLFLRYLPEGVDAGDGRPFRAVATYPMDNAYSVTAATSKNPGSVAIPVSGDAVAFYGEDAPSSAYVAFSGSDYQVEVFDPTPGAAADLVRSGQVAAIAGAPSPAGKKALTAAQLKAEVARLGQTIYWAGPEAGKTYELSATSSGRAFVRYLPEGTDAGDPDPFRTVATYTLSSAFKATEALATKPNMTKIELANGGIAVYDKTAVTNVYVAFPNSAYQIEVFDPEKGSALALVRAGKIVPVG